MADGSISIPPYNFPRKQKQPTNSCKLQRETSYIVRFRFSVSLKIYVALKTRRSLFSNIFAYRLTPGIRCGVLILFTDFLTPVTYKYTRTLATIFHYVHYVRYMEHFDISLALLWDTTIMIRLIIFRTYLKIYLGAARYLVQVRIL